MRRNKDRIDSQIEIHLTNTSKEWSTYSNLEKYTC